MVDLIYSKVFGDNWTYCKAKFLHCVHLPYYVLYALYCLYQMSLLLQNDTISTFLLCHSTNLPLGFFHELSMADLKQKFCSTVESKFIIVDFFFFLVLVWVICKSLCLIPSRKYYICFSFSKWAILLKVIFRFTYFH